MFDFFDPNQKGVVRYFVRPDDVYYLNSLVRVDKDELLYNMLKADGYERVVFLSFVGGEESKFFAYDNLSHFSFIKPKEFEKLEDWRDPKQLSAFIQRFNGGGMGLQGMRSIPTTQPSGEKQPAVGKREFTSTTQFKEFQSNFLAYIVPALKQDKIRTAIVTDADLFWGYDRLEKDSNLARNVSFQISNMLNSVNEEKVKYPERQNVLIMTLSDRSYKITVLKPRRGPGGVYIVADKDPSRHEFGGFTRPEYSAGMLSCMMMVCDAPSPRIEFRRI